VLRCLLTNDDGILSPGLRALALQLAQHAQVTVIAPDSPRSAASHSVTLHKPLRLIPHPHFGDAAAGRLQAYECSGFPADCITVGVQHVLKDNPPHLVISGINTGPNLAEDLIYSGTVAGALEGEIQRIPGIAASLYGDQTANYTDAAKLVELLMCCLLYRKCAPWQAELVALLRGKGSGAAGAWVLPAIDDALADGLPEPGNWTPEHVFRTPCFNVNLPDCALADINGIRWAALGHRRYTDVVVEQIDPRGRPFYWIWGRRVVPPQDPDSDIRGVKECAVTVSPIRGDLLNRTDLPRFLELFNGDGATPAGSAES
jgi:5'-nucleotidase